MSAFPNPNPLTHLARQPPARSVSSVHCPSQRPVLLHPVRQQRAGNSAVPWKTIAGGSCGAVLKNFIV